MAEWNQHPMTEALKSYLNARLREVGDLSSVITVPLESEAIALQVVRRAGQTEMIKEILEYGS